MTKKIAIILARGGSKRLPRKNLLDLGGRPMIAWSIQAAVESNCFDRVLVSTDDIEIAQVSERFGAKVPFLRRQASDDHSTSSEATLVALEQAEEFWGERYGVVAQLMANCPFRDAEAIDAGMTRFELHQPPSQVSAFRFGWMNPWWAARLSSDGIPEYIFPEARLARSQDLPNLYCPSGALWIAKSDRFKEHGSFYMPSHEMCIMDWVSALDIDDEEDLRMAKHCLGMLDS